MTQIHGKKAVSILCLCLLIYIPVQWIGGAEPGSTSIFIAQHREMKQNILEATAALRQQLLFQCAHRGIRDVYFSDADVFTPYLANEVLAQPGCLVHRETVVTPQGDAPKLACSAVLVNEGIPNAWVQYHEGHELGALREKMTPVSSFGSQDKQFNFELLQASSCAHTNVASGPAARPSIGEIR